MSTRNLQLIKCDLCQRQYDINVYQRHREENQCIKRNHHRLPFQSIKQRSVQIGDQIFSVQQHVERKNEGGQISNHREKRNERISTNDNHKQTQRILPSTSRRRMLEQAKRLLERRTKYQPPWIQKRSNSTTDPHVKRNSPGLFTKDSSPKLVNQEISSQRFYSRERLLPPTTRFKNDDLPIKSTREIVVSSNKKPFLSVSNHREYNHTTSQKPIPTHSPKTRVSQANSTPRHAPNRVDQTFSHEQADLSSRQVRKAYTWTRPSKQSINRDVISPIKIPTFCESSFNPFHDRIILPYNQNYDDDEFERYSPTPPSTPKYHQDRLDMKNMLPNVKQNFILDEQQTMIRPNTYQRAKRSDRSQYETFIQIPRDNPPSTFHLPPINLPSNSKVKHRLKANPRPWR